MTILIEDETNSDFNIKYEKLIDSVIKETLVNEEFKEEVEISLTFVDNETIKKINAEYRQKDKETDVLSFPLIEFDDMDYNNIKYQQHKNPETGEVLLGDIIISVEKAKEQAESYGHSIEREIGFLTVHSMLHLLGYDHMTDNEEKQMIEKQKIILERVGLGR